MAQELSPDGKATIREVYAITQRLEAKIDNLNQSMGLRFDELDKRYVTRIEFWPVKTIVYVGAGIILASVLGALVAFVVK